MKDERNATHFDRARITMYGNSCKIKELTDGIRINKRKQSAETREEMILDFTHKSEETPNTPDRKKGDIQAFSKKARLRLLKKLNKFDFKSKGLPYFVTLTYPGRYPKVRETYKADLDVFLKRLKRGFGELDYIWRIEAQKRGAPHYHLIIYFKKEPKIESLKKWVSRNWFEVVQRNWEEKDEKHLRAGTNCKKFDAYRAMVCYVSKYMTKVEQDTLKDQGRHWGASRDWGDELASDTLEGRQLIAFKRLVRKYLSKTNKYMAKKIHKCRNLEVFLPQEFVLNAYLWAKNRYQKPIDIFPNDLYPD